MHNSHFIVIEAESFEEACENVESEIAEWGNENNGRAICGCIDENENTYRTKEGRWSIPETLKQCIDRIKFAADDFDYGGSLPVVMAKFKIDENTMSSTDWWMLQKYCEFKRDQLDFNHKSFNLWEDEYQSWQLSDFGITNLMHGEHVEGMKKYLVVIDMHS